ncbi:hypothetical protein PCE1_001050 [Barthelona sp. PCE]
MIETGQIEGVSTDFIPLKLQRTERRKTGRKAVGRNQNFHFVSVLQPIPVYTEQLRIIGQSLQYLKSKASQADAKTIQIAGIDIAHRLSGYIVKIDSILMKVRGRRAVKSLKYQVFFNKLIRLLKIEQTLADVLQFVKLTDFIGEFDEFLHSQVNIKELLKDDFLLEQHIYAIFIIVLSEASPLFELDEIEPLMSYVAIDYKRIKELKKSFLDAIDKNAFDSFIDSMAVDRVVEVQNINVDIVNDETVYISRLLEGMNDPGIVGIDSLYARCFSALPTSAKNNLCRRNDPINLLKKKG